MSSSVRQFSRHVVLDLLSLVESFRANEPSPKVQFVLLHKVKDCDQDAFSKFLDWLQLNYKVVSYTQATECIADESIAEPVACLSFDDGLKNNLNAARIMSQRNLSGCFFITPNIVGESSSQVVDLYCKNRMLFNQSLPFMNWDEIQHLLDTGHEIGNHSNRHYYMMDLSNDQFDEEVSVAREILTSRCGKIEHFAWPYGRFFHFQKSQVERVLNLGHTTCASGERGCHKITPGTKPSLLRRDSIDISWPLRHIATILKRGSRNPLGPSELWPSA